MPMTTLMHGGPMEDYAETLRALPGPRQPEDRDMTARSDSHEILTRAVGVTRRYGEVVALDDVAVEVPAGQMLGLLGS